ncbi:MAG: B-box zinc finger protein [Hyalangium sp.]|uniref:B-box zinc finger protein n=1 Tax=Hyalangium sp. TaxID=2028555 RepID=UPI00389A7E86
MTDMGFGGMGPGVAGAQCALHPDQPAMSTCTRCGSFMCSTCAEGGAQTLCPSCQQRLGLGQGFPLNRANWSFSALWDYCFEIFKREWLMLSVSILVFFGVAFIVQFIVNLLPLLGAALKSQVTTIVLTILTMIIQQAVQGVLGLGLMRVMFDLLEGQKLDIGRLFSQLHKVGPFLLTMLLVVLMIAIPVGVIGGIIGVARVASGMAWESLLPVALGLGVLAFIPLLYFLIPLFLLQAEIAYSDEPSPMQVLRNCYAYARGERLSIFGVFLVGILVAMVGMLACCVGVLPAMGMTYLLMGGLYLALRNGAEIES